MTSKGLRMVKATQKVLDVIAAKGPVKPKPIREQTGLSGGYISDILNNLLISGRITWTPKGYQANRSSGY